VRLLLDTHTLLWFYLGDPQLSSAAEAAIVDPGNAKFVSPASYWELAIKLSMKKYTLHVPFEDLIQEAVFDNGFEILPIEPRHTVALIPLVFHHKDPFDRMLIAQATVEGLLVVGADAVFDQYGVSRLW
jgi:PIN domain nuclease of toxin-antitoxin system